MTTQGKRLKLIRKSLNLTQEEFGAKLGISKQFYSNIETDRTLLNNDKLVLLFTYYNVNLNYLLGGAGSMYNSKTLSNHNSNIKDDFTIKVENILRLHKLIS